MSKMYVSEFAGLAATDQSDSVDIFPPSSVDQEFSFSTVASSNAFSKLTQFIEFVADGIFSFVIGFAPVTANGSIGATATDGTSSGTTITLTGVTGFVSQGDTASDGTNSCTIGSQVSGVTGSDGVYNCTAGSPGDLTGACTITSNVVHVTDSVSGAIQIGSKVSGSGVTGANVVSQSSGSQGAAGDYVIDGSPQQHASEQLTFTSAIATTTNMRVAAGERMRRKVLAGQCISAITNT